MQYTAETCYSTGATSVFGSSNQATMKYSVIALVALLSALTRVSTETAVAQAAYRATRVSMCRAVVREMHIEIHKHKLRKNGEDDIYETVPAICLAIVNNYTLSQTPAPKRSL